jgi:DNA-binding response OmpR family regulator
MKTKILIVEDDLHIRMGLEEALKSEDFEVVVCDHGDKAIPLVTEHQPALIVLDVMLPGKSGFDICKKLRQNNFSNAILMLTAKSQEVDKVIGLDLGADDYVTKPFGVRELIARIHALLRRNRPAEKAKTENGNEPFKIGGAMIDPKSFEIKRGKATQEVTAKELKLLQLFHQHPNEVFSRDRLLNEVWGYEYYGTTRTLDQTIVQLRKKLGDSASDPKYLITVHGTGYKLVLE